MSKSRKDLFEEQLKDLQKDISSLSQKLASPSIAHAQNITSSTEKSHNDNFTESSRHVLMPSGSNADTKSPLEKIKIELHMANKAKDDAEYRLEQVIKNFYCLNVDSYEFNAG